MTTDPPGDPLGDEAYNADRYTVLSGPDVETDPRAENPPDPGLNEVHYDPAEFAAEEHPGPAARRLVAKLRRLINGRPS